jgi:hypothetical protein
VRCCPFFFLYGASTGKCRPHGTESFPRSTTQRRRERAQLDCRSMIELRASIEQSHNCRGEALGAGSIELGSSGVVVPGQYDVPLMT